jgi:hypothetical protein
MDEKVKINIKTKTLRELIKIKKELGFDSWSVEEFLIYLIGFSEGIKFMENYYAL